MPRIVLGSLLAGAAAVGLGFYLVHTLQTAPQPAVAQWAWDLDAGRAEVGSGQRSREGWRLTLDAEGRGVLVIPLPSLQATRYPFIHMQFSADPEAATLGVFWRTTQSGERMAQYWIPGTPGKSIWLGTEGIDVWAGELLEMAILLQGRPGAGFDIEAIELRTGAPGDRMQALYADWNAFLPWSLSSINKYQATRAPGSAAYPVAWVAALLVASLLLYGIWLLARGAARPDWRVVSGIFLVCWISLDLSWQGKLWQQLGLTYTQFAGKDSQQKLAAGPDAALVHFANYVQQRVDSPDARIFVGSAVDYNGMRGSYYLYPRNVFWRRNRAELPALEYFRRGDYIVLINPTGVRFDPQQRALLPPDAAPVPARLLAEAAAGSLYQVL